MTDQQANFIIEEGAFGSRVVVTSRWSDTISEYIARHSIGELYLNYAKGWKGKDLSFLAECPHLKAFSILDWNIDDVSPINSLHELTRLEVSTYCKTEIDFDNFPYLEECALTWRTKAKTIFSCKSLRKLFLTRYSGKDMSRFLQLTGLESLSFASSPMRNIQDISELKKLRRLGLYNLRKLSSLSGIENLTALEELEIDGCTELEDIVEVSSLKKLSRFQLCDSKSILSLRPLAKLQHLESVLFYGSTSIEDGDLSL